MVLGRCCRLLLGEDGLVGVGGSDGAGGSHGSEANPLLPADVWLVQVGRGLQLQSLWRVFTAAVS